MSNEHEAAIALLRQGLADRYLLMPDADPATLVRTVLVIVDNNRFLRDRLVELQRRLNERPIANE